MRHPTPNYNHSTLLIALLLCGSLGCPGPSGESESESASSGESSSSTADPDGPFALDFEELEIEGGWMFATEFRFIPGTSDPQELLLLGLEGEIGHFALVDNTLERRGTFTVPGVFRELDCGLLTLAFDPDFATNGYIYAAHCISKEFGAITRLTFDPADYGAIAGSAATIIEIGDESTTAPWHNLGAMGFDGAGYLWALAGDKRVRANGQDLSNNLGALIRIDPNREPDGEGYTPAPDNPFALDDDDETSADIYAYGLRSPWRGFLDRRGRYWIGDVGDMTYEEVNVVTEPGQNFGWASSEGPCVSGEDVECGGLTDPLVHWDHDGVVHPYMVDDEEVVPTPRRVAWVGTEYSGPSEDRYNGNLDDKVLFGDYCLGYVRALGVDDELNILSDEHLGHLPHTVAWNLGADGYLYAASFGRCTTQGIDPEKLPVSRLYRVKGVGGGISGD